MYVCSAGYGSESEGEELAGDGAVTVPQHLLASAKSEQNTVKLSEVSPCILIVLYISLWWYCTMYIAWPTLDSGAGEDRVWFV